MADSWFNKIAVAFYRIPWVKAYWGKHFRAVQLHDPTPWTPLSKPLAQCNMALITTGGVHLKSEPPFNMEDTHGDPSYRKIPTTIAHDEVMITHIYYDHTDADEDLNLIMPLEIMRQCQQDGLIGSVAEHCYAFMGHIEPPHVETLIHQTAPEVARQLKEAQVDVVLLVPA